MTGKERKSRFQGKEGKRKGSVPSLPFRASFRCWFRPAVGRSVPLFRWPFCSVLVLPAFRCSVRLSAVARSVYVSFPVLCCFAFPFPFPFRTAGSRKGKEGHRKPHEAKHSHGVNRKRNGASRGTGGRGDGNRHFVHSFTLQWPTFPHSPFRSLLTFKGGALLSVPIS